MQIHIKQTDTSTGSGRDFSGTLQGECHKQVPQNAPGEQGLMGQIINGANYQ